MQVKFTVVHENTIAALVTWETNEHHSLRASDRFIQPVFLRIFTGIGAFRRGNGCDICWMNQVRIGLK